MKIQSIKLYRRYRGLEPFEHTFPKHKLLKGLVDPICLVGLNGSGKSNFLELLTDIFYDIEIYFLHLAENKLYKEDSPKYFAYANRDKDPIYFEIKYKINIKNKVTQKVEIKEVKITRREPKGKSRKKSPIEFTVKVEGSEQNNLFDDYVLLSHDEARDYLPLVVGYTSGLNDLLSMPFIDLQDFYAQQVAKEANPKKVAVNLEVTNNKIEAPNLLLLSYESNAAIVVSNLLLADSEKLRTIRDSIKVDKLNSFRIVIRWNKLYSKRKLAVTDELQDYINKLSDCAAVKNIEPNTKEGEVHTFDFIINDVTKDLFKDKFKTPQKLFEALTKLSLLNTLCIKKEQRNKLRKKREKGQLIKFPQVASLDKIFSIEKVDLVLRLSKNNSVRTEYEKISDGEHQFIHIIGGILLFDEKYPQRDLLYLLDEPDTHFNPIWRSNFFYQLDKILANKEIEFILTTHSPFILSDCHGYNVFKFTRQNEKVTFDRVQKETYGSTFENILDNVFHTEDDRHVHFNNQMAKLSFNRIQSIHSDIEKADTKEKLESVMKEIQLLGESIERLHILKQYSDKEKEIIG